MNKERKFILESGITNSSTYLWVEKDKQNTTSFSSDVMTGLARWKKEREQMIFVLCGAGGFRVGEALGIEIDKHISPDFVTIFVQQKIHHGRVEQRLKTANGFRQVDLHPTIATLFKEFVGNRASGFLFCTRQGKLLSPSNIIRRHLHKALKEGLRQSVHRNAQSWKPCVPSL